MKEQQLHKLRPTVAIRKEECRVPDEGRSPAKASGVKLQSEKRVKIFTYRYWKKYEKGVAVDANIL